MAGMEFDPNVLAAIAKGVDFNPLGNFAVGWQKGQEIKQAQQQLDDLKAYREKDLAQRAENLASEDALRKAQIANIDFDNHRPIPIGDYAIDPLTHKVVFAPPADPLTTWAMGGLGAAGQPPANSVNPSGNPLLEPPANPGISNRESSAYPPAGGVPPQYSPDVASNLPTTTNGPRSLATMPDALKSQLASMIALDRPGESKGDGHRRAMQMIQDYLTGTVRKGVGFNPETGMMEAINTNEDLTQGAKSKIQEDIFDASRLLADVNALGTVNPEFLTTKGALKNMILNARDRGQGLLPEQLSKLSPEDQKYVGEYTTFVNNTEQAFNSYRKWVTGQAAAVKEIEMIRQSFLNKDMGPTQFKAAVAQYQAKLKRGIAVSKQMLDEGVNPKLEKNAAEYDRRFHQTATDRYHEILQRNPSLQPQQIIQMLDQEGFSGTNR